MAKVRIVDTNGAMDIFKALLAETGASEVAVVKNLDFIHSPSDLYPLAPKNMASQDCIKGIAMDMDGTSTTTEPLALHSLEYMMRKVTGRMTKGEWQGLDEEKDFPFIIGNSNFRHTEFLIKRYEDRINREAFIGGFFEAILWTLTNSMDERRRKEVVQNAINCGVGDLLQDQAFNQIISSKQNSNSTVTELNAALLRKYGASFHCESFSTRVSAALDIYYARYHDILHQISQGKGQTLAEQLLGNRDAVLIGPMPGLAIYLSLVKGWLGEEAGLMYDALRELYRDLSRPAALTVLERERLTRLSASFQKHPAKLALVTASIFFEAHTVMNEVFRVMGKQIDLWPISQWRREYLLAKFSDYRTVFDTFVTASDSSEARLKPHRDLYSIALYRMGISREDYSNCIALEDTEPGIIAARGAGFGVTAAMPNHDTQKQDYSGASYVVGGGLAEVILKHNAFLKINND